MADSKTAFSSQGLDSAMLITGILQALEATQAGADWDGGERDYKGNRKAPSKIPSNAEVVEQLSKGGRDLGPSPADQQKAAELLSDELVKKLNRAGTTVTSTKKGTITLTAERMAEDGLTGGLRKAAKHIAAQMYDRLQKGVDINGGRKPVTEAYARSRHLEYGVADSTSLIFIASRQLGEALQTGKIKIRFNSSGLGQALKALNI